MPDIVTCDKCGRETYASLKVCPHCNEPLKAAPPPPPDEEVKRAVLAAKQSGDWSGVPNYIIADMAKDIILTTSIVVANRRVAHEIEIITAECVFGMNIFRDFFAEVRDIIGGRSAATQNVLRDARKTVLTELRREALMVGADAVIAIDIDYSEFSGGYKSMLFVVANGTAVKLASA